MTLADFEAINDADVSLAGVTPELFASLPALWLPSGFHTVEFPDGSHRTFRVRLDRQGTVAGRRALALLVGPLNTDEYEAIGIVQCDGFNLWKRYRTGKVAEHAAILWRLAKGEKIEGYELLKSERCTVCLRPLTDP